MDSDTMFTVVGAISRTPKTTLKQAMLRKYDCVMLRTCINYTYNPFLTYGVRRIDVKGIGLKKFDDLTWRLFNVLASRKLSGNKARSTIKSYCTGLTPQSASLFHKILTRDLRCGISLLTIHKVFPGLVPDYRVMKAEDYDPRRCDWPVYVGVKVDGLRGTYDDKKFLSPTGHPYVGLDHLVYELKQRVDTSVDGELLIPNMSFEESQGRIRSKNPTPDAEFWTFDLPQVNDSFDSRFFLLTESLRDLRMIKIIRHVLMYSHEEVMAYYKQCRNMGFEGVMVKSRGHTYQRKRSFDWMKIKPEDTEDVRCIGIYEGQGKYKGALGGIIVRRKGKIVRVGGGFSDHQRILYFREPDRVIERTCEVLFTERTTRRSLRHPRFKRVRYDK